MLGEWKRENKELYEVWEKESNSKLVGYGYRVKDGKKQITETLTLTAEKSGIFFRAQVPDQNEGNVVSFKLNSTSKDWFSFENLNHDFPKKIQYKRLSDEKISVNVVGEEGEGFSFIQTKNKK